MGPRLLCSVPRSVAVRNDSTFLCVYDESGAIVADYSLCTGLRLVQGDGDLDIYINSDDLVPGRWMLQVGGVSMSDGSDYTATYTGSSEGDLRSRVYTSDDPWSMCGPGDRVSRAERERRLIICKACPLFDATTATCSVNGSLVLDATTYKDKYCPEDLWGNKQDVVDAEAARHQKYVEVVIAQGGVPVPQGSAPVPDDQAAFEAELDQYLEGLQ